MEHRLWPDLPESAPASHHAVTRRALALGCSGHRDMRPDGRQEISCSSLTSTSAMRWTGCRAILRRREGARVPPRGCMDTAAKGPARLWADGTGPRQ